MSTIPRVGDISRRDREGLQGRSRIIWAACSMCGAERWTMLSLYRKQNGDVRCQSCVGKVAMASGRMRSAQHRLDCSCLRCRIMRGELSRGSNPSWAGGRTSRGGYCAIKVFRDDPIYPMTDRDGYVLEHRAVMARALGRTLASYEHVHHINGIKTDNRLSNLELWARPHPSGVRFADYHCPGCQCRKKGETHGN